MWKMNDTGTRNRVLYSRLMIAYVNVTAMRLW